MAITLPLKELPPYEMRRCDLSGQIMFGGDWYYQDTNGKVYLYEAYHERKQQLKQTSFDYNKLCTLQSQAEYREMLRAYQQQITQQSLDTLFIKGE